MNNQNILNTATRVTSSHSKATFLNNLEKDEVEEDLDI